MVANKTSNFSAFKLMVDELEISFFMFLGLMFNFAAILLNFSVIWAILSLKYCRRRQFYILVLCLCSTDFLGRFFYAIFLIQGALCLNLGLAFCRTATWRCFCLLSFSYIYGFLHSCMVQNVKIEENDRRRGLGVPRGDHFGRLDSAYKRKNGDWEG
uniref:G-protein coupled receptors family 1 profile domain-containing protein n=1 Tax=Romanomermis culicivorax TaxID=13658 RepID=A0A915KM76_ROMCU